MDSLRIREVQAEDAAELCSFLNEIVRLGGTTSRREPMDVPDFTAKYVTADNLISCFVAQTTEHQLIGFQCLHQAPNLPANWGDISTFVKPGLTVRGTGTHLFRKTLGNAKKLRLESLNATIRSYNTGGLAFYGKMGFIEYKRDVADPLPDGLPAEKVFKKRNV